MDALQFLHGQILQTPALPTTPLTGRTILITGANSGLSLDAAKQLARLICPRTILACRTVQKGEVAKQDIVKHCSTASVEISTYALDLGSFASVTSFADALREKVDWLDGAILNAGVSLTEFSLSEEGDETTIMVNVLGTFLLAVQLVPHLRESHARFNPTRKERPVISVVGARCMRSATASRSARQGRGRS